MSRAALGLALLLAPAAAEACASCISTPFGDRAYTWPYLLLILLPFAVMTVVGSVMMHVTGARVSDLGPWLTRIFRSPVHPDAPQEERT